MHKISDIQSSCTTACTLVNKTEYIKSYRISCVCVHIFFPNEKVGVLADQQEKSNLTNTLCYMLFVDILANHCHCCQYIQFLVNIQIIHHFDK